MIFGDNFFTNKDGLNFLIINVYNLLPVLIYLVLTLAEKSSIENQLESEYFKLRDFICTLIISAIVSCVCAFIICLFLPVKLILQCFRTNDINLFNRIMDCVLALVSFGYLTIIYYTAFLNYTSFLLYHEQKITKHFIILILTIICNAIECSMCLFSCYHIPRFFYMLFTHKNKNRIKNSFKKY